MDKARVYFIAVLISLMGWDLIRSLADATGFTYEAYGMWWAGIVGAAGGGIFFLTATFLERKLVR